MKIVVENIFMCLVLFWKCYFLTNFSHFFSYFLSIQTNFITENFKIIAKCQSTEQITAKSQHQKSKSQRERSVGRRSVGRRQDRVEARSSGEIEQCGAIGAVLRSTRPVRSGACDRRTGAQGSLVTSKAWSGLPLLSLSLSAETIWSENRNGNEFPWSKLIFYGQMNIIFGKFYFQNQPNTRIYGKSFPEGIFT